MSFKKHKERCETFRETKSCQARDNTRKRTDYIGECTDCLVECCQTEEPTLSPTDPPTLNPTHNPTEQPTTRKPTRQPTEHPTAPTRKPTMPTRKPTRAPTYTLDEKCGEGASKCSKTGRSTLDCPKGKRCRLTCDGAGACASGTKLRGVWEIECKQRSGVGKQESGGNTSVCNGLQPEREGSQTWQPMVRADTVMYPIGNTLTCNSFQWSSFYKTYRSYACGSSGPWTCPASIGDGKRCLAICEGGTACNQMRLIGQWEVRCLNKKDGAGVVCLNLNINNNLPYGRSGSGAGRTYKTCLDNPANDCS